MTRRRWIADEVSGDRAAITGAHADHLVHVLRARPGQEFDIAVSGTVRRGCVAAVADGRVEFELGEEVAAPLIPNITLALSIFKFDRMEWAIEKCTELGATRIVPVSARRTDTRLASAVPNRLDRWRRIARQASEQSRRTSVPEIADPLNLKDAIHIAASLRVVLSEAEGTFFLKDVVTPADEIALACGPEGGWTEDELELFHAAGWISASLGHTILRAETAAIAALAVVVSELH
jgi:16S rRNA (uracil1498-N3)-methyltransferase